ncbi:MAG: hypothetical protein AB7S26_14610 [Sandaracinaceae bacterium]
MRSPSPLPLPPLRALPPLAALVLGTLTAVPASAQLSVELEAPPVRAGERGQVLARVSGAGTHPLLVTPWSEGTAIEVVRGRLVRAEARDPSADVLEFRIPIIARSPGTAVLRVRAAGYVCGCPEGDRCTERCRSVTAEGSLVMAVASEAAAPRATRKQADERAEGARTSSLSWVRLPGAEACVGSAELARAVEERLGRSVFVSAAEGALAVEGRVERVDATWRATIHITDAEGQALGERVLDSDAESCERLGATAATAIALMIDPLTAPPRESATSDPPPEHEDREAETRVIVERVEVPVPAEPEPTPPRWRIEIDASGAGSLGLLPTAALGGIGAVILEIPDFVPIMLEGAIFPFARAEVDGFGQADFLHVHAGFQICPLALRESGIALQGCLGADAGGVFAIGGDPVSNGERVIGQGHASVRGHFDLIGPLTLRVGLHLLIPFRHDTFLAQGMSGEYAVYTPEPVAGMIDLGVGAHFDF